MDGGRSGGDYSLRPGPSGQGLGSLSLPVAEPSRSEYGGRSSPLLRVWRKTTALVLSYSLDLDRDDSFRSMLCLIQEFHSFEEPKSVISLMNTAIAQRTVMTTFWLEYLASWAVSQLLTVIMR